MSYRDDLDALQLRCSQLEQELHHIRERTQELSTLTGRRAQAEGELASARLQLEEGLRRKSLPLFQDLEDLRVASPCNVDWDQMSGTEQVRFCGQCHKNVYNLSSMSRQAATLLLQEHEGTLCVRLLRRADGSVINEDCPVGVKRRRRRRALLAVGGGLLAAAAVAGATATASRTLGTASRTMGAIEPQVLMGEPIRVQDPPAQSQQRTPSLPPAIRARGGK